MTAFVLPNTPEEQVSQLLGCTVEQLDLTAADMDAANARYRDVGDHLADEGPDIYVQGSFMLGTVVRPHNRTGEFDLDLVCRSDIAKTSISQKDLKDRVGGYLRDYVDNADGVDGEVPKLEESRRCWTLVWRQFHMDVLPAVPDDESESPTAIWLTDKQLVRWQPSDPRGYVQWFRGQCAQQIINERKAMAKSAAGTVDDVPVWRVRTSLHRAVQVLKRHRDVYFEDEPDLRPPSSLVTTLAARSYRGEQDLLDATLTVVHRMPEHIEVEGGKWVVAHPVSDENFADKWNEYPERREAFHQWREQVERDLEAAVHSHGTPAVHTQLAKSFGGDPVRRAVAVIAEQTRAARERGSLNVAQTGGALTTSAGIPVVNHRFFGGSPTA